MTSMLHDFRWHFSRPKTLDLGRAANGFQASVHLLLNWRDRQLNAHAAFQSTCRFDSDFHTIHSLSISDLVDLDLVRKERLELSRVTPLVPKTSASTNSATLAKRINPRIITKGMRGVEAILVSLK